MEMLTYDFISKLEKIEENWKEMALGASSNLTHVCCMLEVFATRLLIVGFTSRAYANEDGEQVNAAEVFEEASYRVAAANVLRLSTALWRACNASFTFEDVIDAAPRSFLVRFFTDVLNVRSTNTDMHLRIGSMSDDGLRDFIDEMLVQWLSSQLGGIESH